MKLGYLFVPPHLRRANQIGGAEQGRATVARALGYTEFFAFAENGSADGRSFCGSEGAGFPKQQGPVDQTPPPQLASTGGTARADVVNRGEPIRFLRPDPAANATSEQEPFSPVWADTEALSRQWVAHVTGRTRAARHTHPCEWRVARTVLISENAAVARNMVMAADSPSRNCFRQALGPAAREDQIDEAMEACVLMGDPDAVADGLMQLTRATAEFGTLVLADHSWADASLALRSMILLKDVIQQCFGYRDRPVASARA